MGGKVVLLTQWFDPEPTFKGLVFAKELVENGFDVEVVTGFPNYPGGRLYPGYKMRVIQKECIDGVKITRLPLYPSHDSSVFGRILNYVTFCLSSLFYLLFVVNRPDVLYVYHPPLTTGISALIVRFFRKIPVVYDIQDIWPDSLASTGMLNNKRLLNFIGWLCKCIYKSADRVVVLSPGFRDLLIERGVPSRKIELIYNWCNEQALSNPACDFLKKNDRLKGIVPEDTFVVMFAGNMGYAQALDTIIDTAEKIALIRSDIYFVLLGSGVAVQQIKQNVAEKNICNVKFISHVPMSEVGSYLNEADVLMVHLKDDPLFRITIPSKTQAYMAIGKPIIMAVQGDAADLIEAAECGLRAIPEDSDSIVDIVIRLSDMDVSERNKLAMNGRNFYFDNLSLKNGVSAFSKLFLDVSVGSGT